MDQELVNDCKEKRQFCCINPIIIKFSGDNSQGRIKEKGLETSMRTKDAFNTVQVERSGWDLK